MLQPAAGERRPTGGDDDIGVGEESVDEGDPGKPLMDTFDRQLVRSRSRNWLEAFRAGMAMAADHEDTSQLYRMSRALAGDTYARDYARLLSTSEGGRMAYERVELSERLMDKTWTDTFPPGSIGAAYLKFLGTEHLSMQGLLDVSHKAIPPAELDAHHPYVWLFRRIRDIHDILHTLTEKYASWRSPARRRMSSGARCSP